MPAVPLLGDLSLSGKVSSAAGTPYRFGNEFAAAASITAPPAYRLSWYCSTGTTAPVVIPIIYSVVTGTPTTLLGYGPAITMPTSLAAGLFDFAITTLVPSIVSGTTYLVGVMVKSGIFNSFANTTVGLTGYYCPDSGTTPNTAWGGSGTPGTNLHEAHTYELYYDAGFDGWGVAA